MEWLLAFPRAQTGSVSIQVWGIACATVIQWASSAIVATWALITQKKVVEGSKKEGMAMGGRQGEKSRGDEKAGKKEL